MEWTEQERSDVLHYSLNADFHRLYPGRRTDSAIYNKRNELRNAGYEPTLPPTSLGQPRKVMMQTSQPPVPPTFADLRAAAMAVQKVQQDYEDATIQFEVEVQFDTDTPIGIVWMSDMHLGSYGTELDKLEHDIEAILAAGPDKLRVFIGGDSIDNFILPALSHAHRDTAILNPELQVSYYRSLVDRLLPQVVAVGSGNHDGWTKRMSGLDVNMVALNGLPVTYVGEECYLTFRIGNQTYLAWRKHRPLGASKNNPIAAIMNQYKNGDRVFDLGVTEHHHTPNIATFWGHNQHRVGITTGSYKTRDAHAREYGHVHGKACAPVTVLHPHSHKILPYVDIADAVRYIEAHW